MEKYGAYELQKARSSGASALELAAKATEMARYREMYRNPFLIFAFTLMEPLPVGIILTLVSARLLKRKGVSAFPSSGVAVSPA